jgi:hypothetical protein
MSPRAERPILRNRGAHTVYLSDDLWHALERTYLELRLAGTGQVSKVEFIEATMRAGLDLLNRPTESRPASHNAEEPTARNILSTAEISGLETLSKAQTTMAGVKASDKPKGDPENEATTYTTKPKTDGQTEAGTKRSGRRPNALDRLRQASDPGRPAPIHSVANVNVAEEFSGNAQLNREAGRPYERGQAEGQDG